MMEPSGPNYLDQDGKEETVSIAVEDWFVTDFTATSIKIQRNVL
ncbi:MAG: hypothetical protein AAFV80_17675 [Bacteroidota bacterium]